MLNNNSLWVLNWLVPCALFAAIVFFEVSAYQDRKHIKNALTEKSYELRQQLQDLRRKVEEREAAYEFLRKKMEMEAERP